jgi:hypothetical protein
MASHMNIPSASVEKVVQTAVIPKKRKIIFIKDGSDWKWGAIALLGASTIVAGVILIKQWHYAIIGRVVTNDVVRFLEHNGSKRHDGIIEGGVLNNPLPIAKATTVMIDRALGIVNSALEERKVIEESSSSSTTNTPQQSNSEESEEKGKKPEEIAEPAENKPGKLNTPLFQPVDTRATSSAASPPQQFGPYRGDDYMKKKQAQKQRQTSSSPPAAV